MRDVNKVLLIGRLGADPTTRQTDSGVVFTKFSMATSHFRRSGPSSTDQEHSEKGQKESTVWHRVVAWGREGENCARFLRKGASVFVEGRIRQHEFSTKNGESRREVEVHADRVTFLPSASKGSLTV